MSSPITDRLTISLGKSLFKLKSSVEFSLMFKCVRGAFTELRTLLAAHFPGWHKESSVQRQLCLLLSAATTLTSYAIWKEALLLTYHQWNYWTVIYFHCQLEQKCFYNQFSFVICESALLLE